MAATFATKDAQCQLVVPRGHIERFDADVYRPRLSGADVRQRPAVDVAARRTATAAVLDGRRFGLNRANAVVESSSPVSARACSRIRWRFDRPAIVDRLRRVCRAFDSARVRSRLEHAATWRMAHIETDARAALPRAGRPARRRFSSTDRACARTSIRHSNLKHRTGWGRCTSLA
jgi:hypothetical protein